MLAKVVSMLRDRRLAWFWIIACAWLAGDVGGGTFDTPLQMTNIDTTATVDWVGGVYRTNPPFSTYSPNNQPTAVLFTQTTQPGSGWDYGPSSSAGLRHVRIGFKQPVPIGAVLTMGNSFLSVLSSNAAYPGDVTNDSEWISAERLATVVLDTNAPSLNELTTLDTNAPALNEYCLWIFPPGTTTLALRFSHVSAPSDPSLYGTIYGAYILSNRYANVAPQAVAVTASNGVIVPVLNNSLSDSVPWNNRGATGSPLVSTVNPTDILLIWNTNVTLSGLCPLFAGFSGAEVDLYAGPTNVGPLQAPNSDWVPVANFTNIQYQVPRELTPNWLDFGGRLSTTAIRLRINEPLTPTTPYFNSYGGARVGLAELLALAPLGNSDATSAILPTPASLHPPIPITFVLNSPGIVTLVIENPNGVRVRNLVSETSFPEGTNVVWWDGLDESGKIDLGTAGLYQVQGNLVQPGNYIVRGLVRDAINLSYQFTVGTAGNPPWQVAVGSSGGWLADHRPPSDVIFLPGTNEMMIGSEVAEDGDGLVWTDLNGNKLRGYTALAPGGFYTASHLACDLGTNPISGNQAYAGYVTSTTGYFYGITPQAAPITLPTFSFANAATAQISGLAARNGLLFASLEQLNEIVVINARANLFLSTNTVPSPRGLAFNSNGQLLVLSTNQLLLCATDPVSGALGSPTVLIPGGLDDPHKIALDTNGNFYISQWGNTHNVGVFSPQGAALGSIGAPGPPVAGPYDPTHMNNPNGLAIAGDGRLWVAEYNMAPRRVSIWNTNGQLEIPLYGPTKYGGGGCLDPLDKTRFYYGDFDNDSTVPIPYYIGMEYSIDWKSGSNYLKNVFYRANNNVFHLPYSGPETAIYVGANQYMANALNGLPTYGAAVAGIWQMRGPVAVPVAASGLANAWYFLTNSQFSSRLGKGQNLNNTIFVWSDLNDDGIAESNEVSFLPEPSGAISFYVANDLSFLCSSALQLSPTGFTPMGAPIYISSNATVLIPGVVPFSDAGGGQMFEATNETFVLTGGPMMGYSNGAVLWTYPSQWPDLYASHYAPVPTSGGEMIGTTRLLGGPFTPDSGDAGEIWAVNGNLGDIYLMTVDGLFIATLFHDQRLASSWSMPVAVPGMSVTNVSIEEETFWPTVTKTSDGDIYLCVGMIFSGIVQVTGLESIQRLPATPFVLTTEQLAAASQYQIQQEAQNISAVGRQTLHVNNFDNAPVIDGLLNEWTNNWVTVETGIQAAVAIGQGNLYAAFQTGNSSLLANTGTSPDLLFTTGGGIDFMIGTTSTKADANRTAPAAGDLRLLVSLVNTNVKAILYVPVVPGATNPVAFSSPLSTVYIDSVTDVSSFVTLRGTNGNYELAVPLAQLGLNPMPGQTILGDIGVLIGSAGQTTQRVYWQDKATGLVSDVPSEAELTPQLWGLWQFPPVIGPPPTSLPILNGSQFSFNVQANPGSSIVIQMSSNLLNWSAVTSMTTATSNTVVTLPVTTNAPQLFFRVQ